MMTYDAAVKKLAAWHRQADPQPQRIVLFPDPARQEVRLIEVTTVVPEAGELYPIKFGATAEMPFTTVVAQVTPAEWAAIEAGKIPLPVGWRLDTRRDVAA